MFVRATLELERVDDAVIVPFDALTERDGETRRLRARPATASASPGAPVALGIREGDARAGHAATGLTAAS